MDHVFVLLEDTDMTLRSAPEPTGVAVTTEEEARRWTSAGTYRAYCRVTIRERAADVAGRAPDGSLILIGEPPSACGEMFAGNVCEKPRGHIGAHTGRLPGPRTTEVCQKRLSNGSICGREKDHGGPHAGVRVSG